MVIHPQEAEVIVRLFREFTDGKSIKSLVKGLNLEGVPGRRRHHRAWSTSTVSRILKNPKYIGHWVLEPN